MHFNEFIVFLRQADIECKMDGIYHCTDPACILESPGVQLLKPKHLLQGGWGSVMPVFNCRILMTKQLDNLTSYGALHNEFRDAARAKMVVFV